MIRAARAGAVDPSSSTARRRDLPSARPRASSARRRRSASARRAVERLARRVGECARRRVEPARLVDVARARASARASRLVELGERRGSSREQQAAELVVTGRSSGATSTSRDTRARRRRCRRARRASRPRTGSSRARRSTCDRRRATSRSRARCASASAASAGRGRATARRSATPSQREPTRDRVIEPRRARERERRRATRDREPSCISAATQRDATSARTGAAGEPDPHAIGHDERVDADHQPREQPDLEPGARRCRGGTAMPSGAANRHAAASHTVAASASSVERRPRIARDRAMPTVAIDRRCAQVGPADLRAERAAVEPRRRSSSRSRPTGT